MATEKQGIMSLPQGGEKEAPNVPPISLEESYDAVDAGLRDASPDAHAALQQTLAQVTPLLDQLPDEQLDALIQIFQYLQDHPEEYEEKVKTLVEKGVIDQDTLPAKYDPEVLAALLMVFLQAKKQRQAGNQREMATAMPQPPAGMARGGIAEAARMVASKGRSGDTVLAHINKKEAAMLRKHGGMGTINPSTGLPEYGFFDSIVNVVTAPVRAVGDILGGAVSAVKSVVNSVVKVVSPLLQSPIGKILGTVALAAVLGPGAFGIAGLGLGAAALPVAAGTVTALSGGNIQDVLRSAATAYLGAPGGPVASYIGNAGAAMGVTNAAAQAAINAGITGAGVGLLTGQNLKDAVKSGLIAGAIQGGVTGMKAGFGAQAPNMANAPVPGGGAEAKPLTPGEVGKQIQAGGGAAPTDPLGEFIQKNDQMRAAASMPAVAPAAPGPLQPVPTIGQSLSRIGGGITDMAQGNFAQGFESAKGGLGDLLMPSSKTTAELTGSDVFKEARANGASYNEALKAASSAYNPGILRTYGPGIAAGLGAMGAMGGFQPSNPPQSDMMNTMRGTPGEDLIRANPRKYITQNLPGVQYDETGNIVGSTPWSPSATMADVRAPGAGVSGPSYNFAQVQPPMGAMYTPGPGTLGQRPQVYQPYNTAGMYGNLMPRYAEGGMIDEPVEHRFFGGFMSSIPSIDQAVQTASRALGGGAAPAPTVSPAPAPTELPTTGGGGFGLLGGIPGAVAQAIRAGYTPQMSDVQAAPQSFVGRMSPEARAAFAQRFAQNLAFNPQGAQQNFLQPQAVPQQFNNAQMYSNFQRPAGRGLASLAEGGYPRRTGQISGPGTEKSDSIPAMLSDGEFVMTAKAVRGAGGGSRRAGAKKMYALMHQLERNASRG